MELSCQNQKREYQAASDGDATQQYLFSRWLLFIDYSIENRTNIRFDIDQVRVKLSDKKLSKATNAQVIELNPVMTLEQAKSFKHGFRNVIVLKKMTFPNDKVLTIEMSEKQISGRNILLSIDYEDVLSADSFNAVLLEEE